MFSMTIKGITLFKQAIICRNWHLLVQNCIICLIMVRMNHFNHFKAIKEVSFETKRCLWFKNDFNRFNRTKSLWGPFYRKFGFEQAYEKICFWRMKTVFCFLWMVLVGWECWTNVHLSVLTFHFMNWLAFRWLFLFSVHGNNITWWF